MSKRVARQRKRRKAERERQIKRRALIIISLLLSSTLFVGIAAQWKMLPGMSKPPAQPQAGSFNANSPSKEYVYAGGRLIATEEPAASSAAPLAPANLIAKASSTTQINLTWAAPAGATADYTYQIERSTNYSTTEPEHGFAVIATISGTSFTDNVSSTSVQTYLYRVRSLVSGQPSTSSTMSFGTNMSFAEQLSNQDPGRSTIRATHFTELKQAVDAVRAAAGLAAFNWSDPLHAPASGGPILKSHLKDLRDGLKQALDTLGLPNPNYEDADLSPQGPPVWVKKKQIDELRQAVRGVGQN